MFDEVKLREVVAQQIQVFDDNDASDEDCRESCTIIFDAMCAFLENPVIPSFPLRFLRVTVSRIVREIGPGDTLFRTSWLTILRRCTSENAVKFALEFLPSALLPLQGEETNTTIQQVLRLLESKAEGNTAIDTVTAIFDCIRRLSTTNRLTKKDAFQFCMNHLLFAEKETAIRCLLDHATEEDLSHAVEAVRALAAIDKAEQDGFPQTSSVVAVLYQVKKEGNYSPFFDEYLACVEDDMIQEKSPQLSPLDLVILLLHHDDPNHGPSVESAYDEMVATGTIRPKILSSLTQLVISCQKDLFDSLLWLLLFLCVAPLRKPRLIEISPPLVRAFGVNIVCQSDLEKKERLVLALLQFHEECVVHLNATIKVEEPTSDNTTNPIIHCVLWLVFDILVAAAEVTPEIFHKHHHFIIRSVKTRGLKMDTVKSISKLVVLVDNHRKAHSILDTVSYLDPIFLVRELLFSQGEDDEKIDVNGTKEMEPCVRGLLLVSEMVAFGNLEPTDVSLLWESVRRVLLPPTSRLVHPKIGIEGLRALRSFHEWNERTNQDDTSVLNPGVFPTMTSILMNTRLVKYSTSIDKTKVGVTLGYSNRPECFKVRGNKQRKFHSMVFSFDAFLNDLDFSSPSRWESSFQWAFDLIDTYLTLGRAKSRGKWIPHAWVEAAFAFSSTDLSSLRVINTRQQRTMHVVEGVLNDFDTCTESVTSKGSSHRDFAEVLKQMKKKSERTAIVQGLLRCAFSHAFGLAMTTAILWNTHAHFNDVLSNPDDETCQQQRLEATRLMQYQLAKIYDLVGKCKVMEEIFRGITRTNTKGKRRQKKSNRDGATRSQFDTVDLDLAIHNAELQLKNIVSTVTSTDCYIQTKMLWFCLVDPSHDIRLISVTQSGNSPAVSATDDDYNVIIEQRLNILGHLTRYLQCFSGRNLCGKSRQKPKSLLEELSTIQPFFAQCVRLAAYLSSKSSEWDVAANDAKWIRQLLSLTAYYFRLLLLSMEISLDHQRECGTQEASQGVRSFELGSFLKLYQCIMAAENPLTDAVVLDDSSKTTFNATLNPFLRHLLTCKDATVATELLETLSVFALYSTSQEAIVEMVRVTWTALHSTFPSIELVSKSAVPYAFVEALRRLCPGALDISPRRTARDTAVRETVVKSAFNKSKMLEKHYLLLHGMLRHWGFLVLSEQRVPTSADHLHQLYTNINGFLSEVKDFTSFPKQSVPKFNDDSDQDDEYLPPKTARIATPLLPESTIPGLDARNYFAYFQILLDMTVSSCALFFINEGPHWTDPLNGPYRELCKLVETFGSLVNLYRKRIYVFPQHALTSVLNACRSMLNVVTYQSTQCIEWRSSQPALTADQVETDAFDPASLQYLRRVFDVFGVHAVGTLTTLCDTVDTFTSSSTDSTSGKLFGSAQKQRVKALRMKINKVSSDLLKFTDAHKLPAPRLSTTDDETGEPARKRRRIEIKGFLQFEESAEESEDTNQVRPLTIARALHTSEDGVPNDEGKTLSSDLTWDDGSSEDSFGADGDWGRESEEEI